MPAGLAYRKTSSWLKAYLLILMDEAWMLFCSTYVRLAIICSVIPLVGNMLRRLTFMSGSSDVNANLCLALRILYTLLPPDPKRTLHFDPKERQFGTRFLQLQFRVLIWAVERCGLRILPPPLRPLYISYYARAMAAMKFVETCINEKKVKQLVILGAGFDTTAYRTRELRMAVTSALEDGTHLKTPVRVFEVDLPNVQRQKLAILLQTMSAEELRYYTSAVEYVECNFGVQSLLEVLGNKAFDPTLPTAFLWEGVTYYISMDAVRMTLSQIRQLMTVSGRPASASTDVEIDAVDTAWSKEADGGRSPATSNSDRMMASPSDKPVAYLMLDFMDASTTLCPSPDGSPPCVVTRAYHEQQHESWLWSLEQKLSAAIGTPFITAIRDVDSLLGEYGFTALQKIGRQQSLDLLSLSRPYTEVLFEPNSTLGQNEPNLAIVTAAFFQQ